MDYLCSGLIGINPNTLPFIRLAREQGLCPEPNQIELMGGPLPKIAPPFKLPGHKHVDFDIPGPLKGLVAKLQPKPMFSPELCLGCGECQRACPADAINMVEGKPELILESCIRCFCCQELCHHKAVTVHQHWLGRKLLR
ncbi:hypothetical protein N752_15665 [Desulforamulus aquiferis]|nr:4Fe-4S dicluster domain-containing protein [Desulforamulus aquiferis]RYD04280.1 hypothetical protein N752_15665 [Desulforamulus aquiferis]